MRRTIQHVAAFRAVRFAAERVGGTLDGVVAPPYDVVSLDDARRYLEGNRYNVLQLDMGLQASPGGLEAWQWEAAAHQFRRWIEAGVLRPDPEPAVYILRQAYRLPATGDAREATGELTAAFVELRAATVGAERGALGHERVVDAVKQQRVRQLASCHAHFSPILALVPDAERRYQDALAQVMTSSPPDVRAPTPFGGEAALWARPATSPEGRAVLDQLVAALAQAPAIIADGHHRFEAASEYARLQDDRQETAAATAAAAGGEGTAASGQTAPGYRYVLAAMASLEHGGLSILPVHRIIGPPQAPVRERLRLNLYEHLMPLTPPEVPEALRPILAGGAPMQPYQVADAVQALRGALERTVMAVYWGHGELEWLAAPSKATWAGSGGRRNDLGLRGAAGDIALLHRGPLAGWRPEAETVDAGASRPGWLRYTPYATEAMEAVDRGRAAACLLLAPVRASEVQEAASAGKKLPEKSTYFYPKLVSGLVMADLDLPVLPWPATEAASR